MRGKLRTFMYTFDKQFHLGKKDSFILVNLNQNYIYHLFVELNFLFRIFLEMIQF